MRDEWISVEEALAMITVRTGLERSQSLLKAAIDRGEVRSRGNVEREFSVDFNPFGSHEPGEVALSDLDRLIDRLLGQDDADDQRLDIAAILYGAQLARGDEPTKDAAELAPTKAAPHRPPNERMRVKVELRKLYPPNGIPPADEKREVILASIPGAKKDTLGRAIKDLVSEQASAQK
jgi:hypothetical protein